MKATRYSRWGTPIIAAAVLAASCSVALALLSSGTEAPDFTLKSVDGRTVSFSTNLKGKVVVLRFFTSYIPSCVDEVPGVKKLHEDYKDRGVKVVAVALDSVNGEAVERFVREHNIKYTVLLKDEDQKIVADYEARGVPCGYVIDRAGIVRLSKHGPLLGDTLAEFEEKIKSILSGGIPNS